MTKESQSIQFISAKSVYRDGLRFIKSDSDSCGVMVDWTDPPGGIASR